MYTIKARSVNHLAIQAASLLSIQGTRIKSDKGEVISMFRVLSEVEDPTDRWLTLNGRNNSIVATIAEIMWVLSGSDVIEGWLTRYLPRAPDFSDDCRTWRGAYGPRIYDHGQLQSVIDRLNASNNTRQAVLSIYNPSLDSDDPIEEATGNRFTKDLPCNNLLYFYKDENERLSMHVTVRSNDFIWGAYSINFQEFSVLQEIIAKMVDMEVGTYSVYQNNLHVYLEKEVAVKQFNNVIENIRKCDIGNISNPPDNYNFDIGEIRNSESLKNLFCDLMVDIESGNFQYESILEDYSIDITSELGDWCRILEAHSNKKNGIKTTARVYSNRLSYAIYKDKFNSDLVR